MATMHSSSYLGPSEFLMRPKGSFMIWSMLLFAHLIDATFPCSLLLFGGWGWGRDYELGHIFHTCQSPSCPGLWHVLHPASDTFSICHLVNSFSTFKCQAQSLSKDLRHPLSTSYHLQLSSLAQVHPTTHSFTWVRLGCPCPASPRRHQANTAQHLLVCPGLPVTYSSCYTFLAKSM